MDIGIKLEQIMTEELKNCPFCGGQPITHDAHCRITAITCWAYAPKGIE